MDVTPVYKIFKVMAVEFKTVPYKDIKQWILYTAPLVSKKRFGNLYEQALALLTAHRMKLSSVGVDVKNDPLAEVGNISVGSLMKVGSYSEGETSINFNNIMTQNLATDAELALTPYGIQYLGLRRMRIMPITSAGESYGRA